MVETVIVLPVLLLVLFAVLEFSVVLGRWQALSNAAREGARLAIVYRTGCNTGAVQTEVRNRVAQYAASLGMASADLDVDVTGVCGDTSTTSIVTVRSEYRFRVLGGFAESLTPTLDLTARSVMRNEGSG